MSLEIPIVFKYHVFACFTKRPPGHPRGSCMDSGAQPLWERLQQKVEAKKLPGPLMVVYPEGIRYHPEKIEDIDEIIQSHFVEGNPVERLIIVPKV